LRDRSRSTSSTIRITTTVSPATIAPRDVGLGDRSCSPIKTPLSSSTPE
jgi:hypothetical protein